MLTIVKRLATTLILETKNRGNCVVKLIHFYVCIYVGTELQNVFNEKMKE